MIRKPDAKVFQDSTSVKVVRGTQLVVGEGGKSAMQATARLWMGGMVAMAMLVALSGLFSGDPKEMAFAVAWIGFGFFLLWRMFRAPTRTDAIEQIDVYGLPLAATPRRELAAETLQNETIQVRYWPKALFNKAFTLAILGVLVTVLTGFLAIIGVLLIARGVLLIAAGVGSRNCLEVNAAAVTVHNLLGTKAMPLASVESVFVHTFRRRRLDVSCLVGSRKVIAIEGRIAGERRHLLVPYTMLGMSREAAGNLCDELLRRAAGAAHPAPPQQSAVPAAGPAYADTPEATFDPDAVMARYLAERRQVIEASGMPRPPGGGAPRGFGRKGLVAGE